MTVRLRGHHLLCLLTYKGEGYGPAFVANLDRIAARLAAGEAALVVEGPDDICGPLAEDDGDAHCHLAQVKERDRKALVALTIHMGRPLEPGRRLVLDPTTVAGLRAAFAAGGIRPACAGCEWNGLCTAIADAGFAGVRLPGTPEPSRP
ncbi:DUF1284 domain-containing protein [Benzoatithermus flavus]|uniref:DUF1284 domain-containing protein n=1 Tax=Benzoatithermus flavus TaxID=3108223 RepID=A0ABU8XSC9_9PROT